MSYVEDGYFFFFTFNVNDEEHGFGGKGLGSYALPINIRSMAAKPLIRAKLVGKAMQRTWPVRGDTYGTKEAAKAKRASAS